MFQKRFQVFLALCALCLGFTGCGGGGGGGEDDSDFASAAQVSINSDPGVIDSGNRVSVVSRIWDVSDEGIILKYRYPKGMSYIRDTVRIDAEGQNYDTGPNVTAESGSYKYLVFFLPRDTFGRDNEARITFYLKGDSEVTDGRIEIDADADDPNVPNSREFNVQNPQFTAEDQDKVEVR